MYIQSQNTKSIQSPSHIPYILSTFIIFSVCVCFANRIGGFRVRDERRTSFALLIFSTLSVLLPVLSGCLFFVFISAEPLLSISKWSSESLMCKLTIEMFLANTFPSFFLLTIISGPFTLATVNKSFTH